MHDPMVVAWDVPAPWLRRCLTILRPGEPAWAIRARRRTNPENLGERVYPWWRPKGYRLVVAGAEYGAATLATIWHVEPGGRDSGEVCRHHYRGDDGVFRADGSWRWHVHHWRVRVPALQALRRRLLTRCASCGGRHRKHAPVNCSGRWGGSPRSPWWRGERDLYHAECHAPALAAHRASGPCDAPAGTTSAGLAHQRRSRS